MEIEENRKMLKRKKSKKERSFNILGRREWFYKMKENGVNISEKAGRREKKIFWEVKKRWEEILETRENKIFWANKKEKKYCAERREIGSWRLLSKISKQK